MHQIVLHASLSLSVCLSEEEEEEEECICKSTLQGSCKVNSWVGGPWGESDSRCAN